MTEKPSSLTQVAVPFVIRLRGGTKLSRQSLMRDAN